MTVLGKTRSTSSHWVNLTGASKALAILGDNAKKRSMTKLIVCNSDQEASHTRDELLFFGDPSIHHVLYIPGTETLPYDIESPHPGLVSERATAFHTLATSQPKGLVVVLSVDTLMRRIASKKHWQESIVDIEPGVKFDLLNFETQLIQMGYVKRDIEIEEAGEFAIRNNIVDVFPIGPKQPFRFYLEEGVVDTTYGLNINTQRRTDRVGGFRILPAREIPVTDQALSHFRTSYRDAFERGFGEPVFESVLSRQFPEGIEFLLPLFDDNTTSIFDYLPSDPANLTVYCMPKVEQGLGHYWENVIDRHKDLLLDKDRRLLEPSQLWLSDQDVHERLENCRSVWIEPNSPERSATDFEVLDNQITRQPDLKQTLGTLAPWAQKARQIIFCLHSDIRVSQLNVICEMLDIELETQDAWTEISANDTDPKLLFGPIDHGFYATKTGTLFVTEREIFGQPIFAKNEDNYEESPQYKEIQDLKNLSINDPVVHLNFGVGRFSGLEAMSIGGVEQEFFTIAYAKDAKTYVKMQDLHLVSRFGGMSIENAPLDEMGSEKWLKGLDEAVDNVKTTAQTLLNIQAERLAEKGLAISKPGYPFQKFRNEFPFQETIDQKKAVHDIIEDLCSPRPMDRTVVGDVGFGKTEVAQQSAFLAVHDGFQVAVMVPTTLLANQHFENFKERFASFPDINIQCMTRLERGEEKSTLSKLKSGQVDIVIGTHRLIQSDVQFKNLGLLVIDEEHRFGVKHKEKLREMRSDVNVLSMTATPIPRTLSMSLHGVKDLSIIATPPAKRLSIRTLVREDNDSVIKEAVQREMLRGGQIFYLHNSIESIVECADRIQAIVPDARIAVGHGKMHEKELEHVMADFYRHEFDILVCTTIIETGIDIPNANTILIEKADRFGLAQLHQLRGRVGRSHHQAYAYLLTSDSVSESAQKRLHAMEKANKLGEGFVLANHDLEIRGAGELLGEEQSGQMQAIGFSLYMRILERAIQALQEGKPTDNIIHGEDYVNMDLGISGLIERHYIEDQRTRLSIYKRLATAETINDLKEIQEELLDRFGDIPAHTLNLVNLSKIRSYLRRMGVGKMIANERGGFLELKKDAAIPPTRLLDLVDQDHKAFRLKSPQSVEFDAPLADDEERIRYLVKLVTDLASNEA